jgi:hypothetical protein
METSVLIFQNFPIYQYVLHITHYTLHVRFETLLGTNAGAGFKNAMWFEFVTGSIQS